MSSPEIDVLIDVLVVEDDRAVRTAMKRLLESRGCHVREAETVAQALSLLAVVSHALIDLRLPDGDGCEVLREIRAHHPTTKAAIVSAEYKASDLTNEACTLHPDAIFHKPANVDAILTWLGVTPAVREARVPTFLLPKQR